MPNLNDTVTTISTIGSGNKATVLLDRAENLESTSGQDR
jgi:hypothetical protein